MGWHKKRRPGRREIRELNRIESSVETLYEKQERERRERMALREAEEIPLEELEAASELLDRHEWRNQRAV